MPAGEVRDAEDEAGAEERVKGGPVAGGLTTATGPAGSGEPVACRDAPREERPWALNPIRSTTPGERPL
jgi:hypothetical protein